MSCDLIVLGDFTLHSGSKSDFKIDCDVLSDACVAAFAKLLADRLPKFKSVYGIPRGGIRLAEAMLQYARPYEGYLPILIADDVCTSGASLEKTRLERFQGEKVIGAVMFNRGLCPKWVTPLFYMHGKAKQ